MRRRRRWGVLALAVVPTTALIAGFSVAGAGLDSASPDSSTSLVAGADRPSGTSRDSERQTVVAGSQLRATVPAPEDESLPADSGSGRRAVYSESRQRVWIVEEGSQGEAVTRTYLVSGSIYDNLDPGTYEVYSRSEHAWGIDDSGTMEWFVRFTKGDNGAAIGFHDIPVKDGAQLQSEDDLGTATSHGCIRQQEDDALAMWDFAQLGTTVVVTP